MAKKPSTPRVPGERTPDLSRPLEEMRARIYPEIEGLRVDQALAKLMPWRSRASLQRLIREGHVRVEAPEGADPSRSCDPARASMRVRREDVVAVRLPERPRSAALEELPVTELSILYEDDLLVSIDKPAGLTVHPVGRRLDGTLINLLHERYRSDNPKHDVVPRLCHRLDRETSGQILVAKDELAHAEVRRQFERLEVRKSYLALVEGVVADDSGWIDLRLGPDSRSPIRLKIAPRKDGLEALTEWRVQERGRDVTLLECFPKTGRQHQIRVHLAAIGHPVIGDKLYGPDENFFLRAIDDELDEAAWASLRMPRQALHSHRLTIKDPRSGEARDFVAPLPEDMGDMLASS